MTIEEAIAEIERLLACAKKPEGPQTFVEFRPAPALEMALTALRPVSRERVEKVWPGCEACKNAGLAIGEVQFYGPFEGSIDVSGNMQYCPNCGRPITPAAQEEQLERLEALKDAVD